MLKRISAGYLHPGRNIIKISTDADWLHLSSVSLNPFYLNLTALYDVLILLAFEKDLTASAEK